MPSSVIDSSGFLGVSIIIKEDKNEIRLYLLGQLEDADQERLELRLLTEPSLGEEFDTIVDEITDQYVGNELGDEERKRVEQYFLASSQRQQKVAFARELLEHAATERAPEPRPVVDPTKPGFWEGVRAFWRNQSVSMRTATTLASLVIVAGLGLFVISSIVKAPGTYQSIALNISASDRATGSEVKRVKLEQNTRGLRIELALPDQVPQAENYRVELLDEQQQSRDVSITERTAKSLLITIPAYDLTRGSYYIHLHAKNPDGSKSRIRGDYRFSIE